MTASPNAAPQILFVDDETTAVKYFQRAVETLAPVITAASVADGKRLLDEHASTLSVLISDQRMPGGYGNELLQYAHSRYPNIVRILTTAYSELGHTIDAVNQGQIHRYIHKPWDLSALKMELKQALELAALRKEHAQLLREKLLVRQTQTISTRIGALHSLCLGLSAAGQSSPLESYLSAAYAAGVKTPEPNWLLMDYADVVSAESMRTGQFSRAVRGKLEEIQRAHPETTDQGAVVLLKGLLGDAVTVASDGSAALADVQMLVEFLEMPSDAPVSARHVSWLAYLLWLQDAGKSLQVTRTDAGMHCRVAPAASLSTERLATWISQFCDAQQSAAQATVTSLEA
jgi:two-component system probable response regulator PhcQ